jgi:hypothetical protein
MKTFTEKKFDRVIKEGFHEVLKPLGFKKKANNFYLQRQDLGQIINIQKSGYFSKDQISFTINTGLFLPEYWRGLSFNQGKEIPSFPCEASCLIRKRIGALRKQNNTWFDTWFDIDEKTDENTLIVEMKLNLIDYILPYFDQNKTRDAFLNLLDTEKLIYPSYGKLIVYAELKQLDKAKNEYLKILNDTKNNSHFLETIKEYGQKYGLA